jgi:hypothetical protein
VTETEYEKIDAVRWSRLRSLRKSALQYKHDIETERDDAAHFRIGRAIHCYVLEPESFDDHFVCYRDSKSVGEGAKKRWQAFQEANADKTILDVAEYEAAVGAARALLSHPVASAFLVGGLKEHTVTWVDEKTGLRCKARLDHYRSRLVDIKSGRDIVPRVFAVTCARLGYHAQAAFYLDGALVNGYVMDEEPVLLAVESSAPFDVVPYRLGDDVIKAGRAEYGRLLARLKECQERDEWPGLAPDAVVDLELPAWATGEPVDLVMPDGEVLRG